MKSKIQLLSHFLNQETPCYAGNTSDISIEAASCICSGDSANSLIIKFKNHIGTHIDLPRHFSRNGKTLSDYPDSFWFFSNIQLIDLPCKPSQMIMVKDLEHKINNSTDFLIIKTGFESYRSEEAYWNSNPGIHSEVGHWLREKFPCLRAIGFDFISLSSFKNREEGRKSHRAFLDGESSEPIVIIEDMFLSEAPKEFKEIIISPLLIENADGVPVTIFSKS